MDSLGSYFPPMGTYTPEEMPLEVALESRLPAPPTSSSTGTVVPILDSDTLEPTMNAAEHAPDQFCSCPISDPCVLETLALLYGSLCILEAAAHFRVCAKSTISTIINGRREIESGINDLLSPLVRADSGPSCSLRPIQALLKPDMHAPGQDVCQDVRCRVLDLDLDLVDVFPPLQHHIHILLKLLDFDKADFWSHFNSLRDPHHSHEIGLMHRAYDRLTESSVKVFPSQFEPCLEKLKKGIEAFSFHMELDALAEHEDEPERFVECVAAEMRMSWSTPKFLNIQRAVVASAA